MLTKKKIPAYSVKANGIKWFLVKGSKWYLFHDSFIGESIAESDKQKDLLELIEHPFTTWSDFQERVRSIK